MYNEDKILKQFGLNLKAERIRKGLSQQEFAIKSNKNREYISKLERGVQNPSLKKIVELANILETDINSLLRF